MRTEELQTRRSESEQTRRSESEQTRRSESEQTRLLRTATFDQAEQIKSRCWRIISVSWGSGCSGPCRALKSANYVWSAAAASGSARGGGSARTACPARNARSGAPADTTSAAR